MTPREAAQPETPKKLSLELEGNSPVFSPDKADENLSEEENAELAKLMGENETMRLRLAEINAELAEDGPDSPGYGSNPLNETEVISDEPLLQENPSRFVIFPISDHDVWAMYKKAEAKFWNSEEIDLVMDKPAWATLAEGEQKHLLRLLPNTCEIGQLCLDNLLNRFTQEVQSTEARMFYGNQIAMLNMHNEMYASVLDQFLPGAATQAQLISEVRVNPAAQKKLQWCQQWMDSTASFGLRLVAFAAVQSIMHAGTFASMYKCAAKGDFTGISHAVENIATDTAQYVDFAGLLCSMLVKKPAAADIERIVRDAVEVEKDFILKEFKAEVLGIDPTQLSAFVEHTADLLMGTFKQGPIFNTTQPFDWMNRKESAMKTSASASAVSPGAAKAAQADAGMDNVLSFGLDDDDF